MKQVNILLIITSMVLVSTIIADDSFHDLKLMSKKRLQRVMDFICDITLYDHLSDVMVKFVFHFEHLKKLEMKTRFGYKTILLTPEIRFNITKMVQHMIHMQYTRFESENKKFPFKDPVTIYRFVRNNTIVLDRIIYHLNESLNKHNELEHYAKIQNYNKVRQEYDFFKRDELYNSMKILLKEQMDAGLTLEDIANGKPHGNGSKLHAEESSDLAKFAYRYNTSLALLFYEASLPQYDEYISAKHHCIVTNKSQVLDRMIEIYEQYGDFCTTRVKQLQAMRDIEIEKGQVLTETKIDDITHGFNEDVIDKKVNDKYRNHGDDLHLSDKTEKVETNQGEGAGKVKVIDGQIEKVKGKDSIYKHETCIWVIINQPVFQDKVIHDEF
ncbi:hypothetical protein ACF0H5_024283 [Mactra antiquata]